MLDAILQIDSLNDLTSVLEYSRGVCREHGVKRQSYHFSPIFDEPNSMRTIVHADGYQQDWLDLYESSDFRSCDPIPSRTYDRGAMLTWHEAMTEWPNSDANEELFAAMKAQGLIHGFGLPLFGPRGRSAYASMDFGVPVAEVDPRTIVLCRILAQFTHQRLCNLIDEARSSSVELSDREAEVLTWMARGKSNTEIAAILSVSPETVKTYRERVYQKLGINDRIGAVIRALKLGLIHI